MRNRNETVARRPASAGSTGFAHPTLLVPAATTILALLLGAAINTFQARRLERQKFEFEVLKYVVGVPDSRQRLKLLCDFAELGFIPDPGRRYHRQEFKGIRVCAPDGTALVQTAEAIAALRDEVGDASSSTGAIAFEGGILKIAGGVGDVRSPTRPLSVGKTIKRIEIVPVIAPDDKQMTDVEPAARSSNVDLVVDRGGGIAQFENIFSGAGTVRLGLLTAGTLRFGTETRGIGFRLYDRNGKIVPRSEGIDYVHTTSGGTTARQRLSQDQLRATRRLIATLCTTGNMHVSVSRYLVKTAAMSWAGFAFSGCHDR